MMKETNLKAKANKVYFICKHCRQKIEMSGYLDIDDFESGDFNGNSCKIALQCGTCNKYNGFEIRAFELKNSVFAKSLNKDIK